MSKPKAPPAPDYAALAQQQASANKDAAQYNTELNRVNQYTPYGSSTWSNQPTLNKAAYDAAQAKYSTAEQDYLKANPDVAAEVAAGKLQSGLQHYQQYGKAEGRQGNFTAPNEQDFMTPGWSNTVTLDPAQQQLLESQNRLSQGYANTAESALGRVSDAMASKFDTSGLPALSGGPQAGTAAQFNPRGGIQASGPDASKYQVGNLNLDDVLKYSGSAASVSSGGPIAREFDTSGVRKLPGEIDDASRRRVEEALMSRINPQYASDEQALRTRLLNSGIEVGTDAYNREMNNFSQRLNDARMQAVLAGGQEESRQVGLAQGLQGQEFNQALSKGQFGQGADIAMAQNSLQAGIANANLQQQASRDRMANMLAAQGLNMQGAAQNYGMGLSSAQFGNQAQQQQFAQDLAGAQFGQNADQQRFAQELASGQFGNQARQQGIQEQAYLRQLPLNEINALRSGSQVQGPQFGSYYTGGQAGAAPVFGAGQAQADYNQQLYQQQQGGYNALLGGLAGLGSAGIGAYFGG